MSRRLLVPVGGVAAVHARPEAELRGLPGQPGGFGLQRHAATANWRPDYVGKVTNGTAGDLNLIGWTGDYGDPDNFLGVFFGSYSAQFNFHNNADLQHPAEGAHGDEPGQAHRAVPAGEQDHHEVPARHPVRTHEPGARVQEDGQGLHAQPGFARAVRYSCPSGASRLKGVAAGGRRRRCCVSSSVGCSSSFRFSSGFRSSSSCGSGPSRRPGAALLGERATAARVAARSRHRYGLDRPIVEQYWDYLKTTASGDLGRASPRRRSVTSEISAALPGDDRSSRSSR